MDQYKINQILRISKMHYELGMSQIEIAKKEHLSKSTVSRLLKSAMDIGLIKISIIEPIHSFCDLEAELLSRFQLKKIAILPDMVHNKEILCLDVCNALAGELPRIIHDNTVIGIAWGNTLSKLSNNLQSIKPHGLSIIQLNGGFSKALYDTGASNIVRNFVDHCGGEGYLLPAPAIVDTPFIAKTIMTDSSVKRIFNLAKQCQIAIFSVGRISQTSILSRMGFFSQEEYSSIQERAIGDVCSHFIDKNGQIACPELDDRVIAIPLNVIKKIPKKILIAVGEEKAQGILACLYGKLVDYLYIDYPTAITLLKLDKLHSKR